MIDPYWAAKDAIEPLFARIDSTARARGEERAQDWTALWMARVRERGRYLFEAASACHMHAFTNNNREASILYLRTLAMTQLNTSSMGATEMEAVGLLLRLHGLGLLTQAEMDSSYALLSQGADEAYNAVMRESQRVRLMLGI